MVNWQELIDKYTQTDEKLDLLFEVLTELKNASISYYQHQTGSEPPEGRDMPIRHLPFVSENAILAGQSVELEIRTDPEQGLGISGRSGYFRCDGPGAVLIVIFDGVTGQSIPQTLNNGEFVNYPREDGIWFDKVILTATALANTNYRCVFTR